MPLKVSFKRFTSKKITAVAIAFSVLIAPYAAIGPFGIDQASAATVSGVIRAYSQNTNTKEWIDLGQKFKDGQQNSTDIPNKVIQMYFTSSSGSTTPTDNIALDKITDSDLGSNATYEGERNLLENFNNQEIHGGNGTLRDFFVIDSDDGSEFTFDGIGLYNLGAMDPPNSKVDIQGFLNGVSTGQVTVTVNGSSGNSVSMLTASDLPSAKFGNVDRVEISMNPNSAALNGYEGLNFGFNSISIKAEVNDAVNSVSVSPPTSNVQQGSGQQLTATVNVTGSASQAVNWTSNDADGKVTVNSSGYVSVAADATPQNYTITATSVSDGTKKGTATITVTAAPTYTIAAISDQTLNPITAGYASGSQETKTVTVTRTGTGTLSNVAATLSGIQAASFDVSALSATTLDNSTPSATFTVKAKDGLLAGTYTATVSVSADNMTDRTFTVTQVVNAAPTYTIAAISDQTLNPVTAGYASGSQETKTVTVTRTGTGTLSNVAATLSGTQAASFDVSALSATTLDNSTPSAAFTVKAKDGLLAGTYTATVTVSADNMTDRTFTVTQVVNAAPTYTIAAISDQTLNPVTAGYMSGSQETKTVTVTRTGTGTLSNVAATLSGAQAASFDVSALSATTLDGSTPSATFTVKAKDGLSAGTYTATVTVSANNMTDRTFAVTQVVNAPLTYTIDPITNQTLNPLTAGYASGSQDKRTLTVTRSGTGTLSNLAVALSGEQAASFEISALSETVLDDETPSAAFSIKAKDGLPSGLYTVTVTVSATNMTDRTFTVKQAVFAAPTYTIAPIADQTLNPVTAGYVSGSQETKTVTVTRTGTGTLSNVTAALSGPQASSFDVSSLSKTILDDETPSATFMLKAKDGLSAGTYTATVTVSATNMTGQSFTVTQTVSAQGQAAAPSASPSAGAVTAGTLVTLSSTTGGSVIHYTTDGSEPTANSPVYSTPVAVNSAMTIKAVAVKNGLSNSPVLTASYTIAVPNPQTPTPQTPVVQTPAPTTPIPSSPAPSTTSGVDVWVNGKVETAGTATTSDRGGQSVVTIAVDEQKLRQRLDAEGSGAVITIPVNMISDVVVGELNGQMVKNMENKQAVVELRTNRATYTLPARQIDIDAVSSQVGANVALQDIRVKIEISAAGTGTQQIVEQAARSGGFVNVAPALDFTVSATYGEKTVSVNRFNAYVKRAIAIPEGVDPNRITTGVVVDPDGTSRHVPTRVLQIDGKFYAEINSLTNSTYSVVWHPIIFADAVDHWAETAVNDMGSRMVVNGFEDGLFRPNQNMTRAEFAEIMVRGLGLKPQTGKARFVDVKETDWYNAAVLTASEFGLINGFEDGTFRPQEKISREQAMQIMAKAMNISGLKQKLSAQNADMLLAPFADAAKVSAWAKNSVSDNLQAGIVIGRSGEMLAPQAGITRAEVAVMIRNLLGRSNLI